LHQVGDLFELNVKFWCQKVNNTSPEALQRPFYVNVRPSIKTNLNLFLPLCNYGNFRFTKILDWNMTYTNAGLNVRKDLIGVWYYCMQHMDRQRKPRKKTMS
jgi:hypothetical protein